MKKSLYLLLLIVIGCIPKKELPPKEAQVHKVKLLENCLLLNEQNRVIKYIAKGSVVLLKDERQDLKPSYLGKISYHDLSFLANKSKLTLQNPKFEMSDDSISISVMFLNIQDHFETSSEDNNCFLITAKNEKIPVEPKYCGFRGNRFVTELEAEILDCIKSLAIQPEQKQAISDLKLLYDWDNEILNSITHLELEIALRTQMTDKYHLELNQILGPELYADYLGCSKAMSSNFYW